MCKKQKHYYGCIQSKLDGTEHVANVDEKLQLPEEFDLRKIMPPVRNQGNTQTCVCQSLTGVLDVLYNEINDQTAVCNNFPISELYNSRSNKPQEGMCFKDALKYLRRKGLKGFKINSYALVPSVDALKDVWLCLDLVFAVSRFIQITILISGEKEKNTVAVMQ